MSFVCHRIIVILESQYTVSHCAMSCCRRPRLLGARSNCGQVLQSDAYSMIKGLGDIHAVRKQYMNNTLCGNVLLRHLSSQKGHMQGD